MAKREQDKGGLFMADFTLFLEITLPKNQGSCKGHQHVHIFFDVLNSLKFLPDRIVDGITEDALEELVEKSLRERS